VHWVSENLQPFDVVNDRSFHSLMKTGQPAYYLLHSETVARDVRLVFSQTKERIAGMPQVRIYNNVQINISTLPEIQWKIEFCNRCMDSA